MNPRCPPALAAIEATTAEVDQGKATKEPKKVLPLRTRADFCLSLSSLPLFVIGLLGGHHIYVTLQAYL